MADIQERSAHYERVRSITILLVVLGHVSVMYSTLSAMPQPVESSALGYLAEFLYAFHIPMFMAISGMVYGLCVDDLDKYHNYFKFIWNKVLRLLVPYMVFGCLYVAPVVVYLHLTECSFIDYLLHDILRGGNPRHLWFLGALFLIFVVAGILRPLLKHLPPIVILIPMAVLSYYAITDFPFPTPTDFQFRNACKQAVWFFFGYAINRHYDVYMRVLRSRWAGAVCLLVLLASFLQTEAPYYFVSALAGIGMMLSLSAQWSEQAMDRGFFKLFKRDGMGIYLFHPMIIYAAFYYFGDKGLPPLLFASLVLVVALVLSIAATELLYALHLNVLMGEATKKYK